MSNPVRHFSRVLESEAHTIEPGWTEWGREQIPSLNEPIILLEREGELPLTKVVPLKNITTDDCKICNPPLEATDTVKDAAEWLAGVASTLFEKNAAYGDSASNPLRVFSRSSPVEQLLVRIDDKLSRISRGAGLLAADEDVVRDLVGYLALLAVLQNKER